MAYSLLRDVNSSTQTWRVRVRIARTWEHLNANRNNEFVRFQFVMVDEKGCAMQGSIAKVHMDKFAGRLLEGHAYYLQYLDIRSARETYRAVDHPFEAWLTKWTGVIEITPIPESLPRYAYKLRSFQSILANVTDKTYLADVIGIVTGVSPAVTIDVKGRPTQKRTLRLTDTRETATVALWGSNAESINSEQLIDAGSREPVVVLVMGCTHRKQDSMLELSASFGSQVCINMDIPEIVALRDRLVGSVYPAELTVERGRHFESNEVQVVSVPELADMNPHVAAGKKFRCRITIEGLQPNQGWWYLACDSCTWKSVAEGASYKCTNEQCRGRGAGPRLRIPVIAAGEGASVEMVFFVDVARDMVGKPADILVAENCGLFSAVPPEIAALTGRSYVVDVTVSRYSFRSEEIRFQVSKFYPEGSSVFVSLLASAGGCSAGSAGNTDAALAQLASSSVTQGSGSSSGGVVHQAAAAATSDAVTLQTTPSPAALGAANKPGVPDQLSSISASELEAPLGDLLEKKSSVTKRQLFPESTEKTGTKVARNAK